MDWTIATDWSDLLPMTVYMECVIDNSYLSLGADLYSLNPQTGETMKLMKNWL